MIVSAVAPLFPDGLIQHAEGELTKQASLGDVQKEAQFTAPTLEQVISLQRWLAKGFPVLTKHPLNDTRIINRRFQFPVGPFCPRWRSERAPLNVEPTNKGQIQYLNG